MRACATRDHKNHEYKTQRKHLTASLEHAGVQNSPIARGITGGQNAFVLKHENDGAMRGARAMDDSLGNYEALSRLERDGTIFEVDKQLALDHVEELVVRVVLVPVVRTLDDA